MRRLVKMVTTEALTGLLLPAVTAEAQNSNADPRAFEVGFPRNASKLLTGPFHGRLVSLPATVRGRALQVSQAVHFSEPDLEVVRIDGFRPVTLRGKATDGALAHATLHDFQTGSNIAVGPGGSHTFTMDSEQNRFRLSLR